LATIKWPNSCKVTAAPKINMKARTPMIPVWSKLIVTLPNI